MPNKEILTGKVVYSDPIFEFKLSPYQVYAKSKDGLVYTIYSTCFQPVEEGDTFIKEGYGDEFVHVGYYQVYDSNMCHNYKIAEGKIVECTEQEKAEELKQMQKNMPKTTEQKVVEMAKAITDLMLEGEM